jgi:hypothetical protein
MSPRKLSIIVMTDFQFHAFRRTENYDRIIDAITSYRIASVQVMELLNTSSAAFSKLLAVCQGVKRDDDKNLSDVRISIRKKNKPRYNEKFESHIIQKFNEQFEGVDVVIKKLTAQLHMLRDGFFEGNEARINDPLQGFNRNIFTHISKLIGTENSDWNNYYGSDNKKTWIDSSEDEEYFDLQPEKEENQNAATSKQIQNQENAKPDQPSQNNTSVIPNSTIEKSHATPQPQTTQIEKTLAKKHVDINLKLLDKKLLAGEGIFKYTLQGFENCPLVKDNLHNSELSGLERFQALFFDTLVSTV